MLKYYYLDISLQTEPIELTEAFFKQQVIEGLSALFGFASQAFCIDLLKYNPESLRGIIRVSADQYVKVRAGLTLSLNLQGNPANFYVHKASPLLLSLQGDSRDYIH